MRMPGKIFNITLLTVTVLFLFAFFTLVLDAPRNIYLTLQDISESRKSERRIISEKETKML